MERLAKSVRQAVLPLAILMGGCATAQSAPKNQGFDLADIKEEAPLDTARPNGFERTNLAPTKKGYIFDLSTFFKVGGSPGFSVKFEIVRLLAEKAPDRVVFEKGVKPTYDIVDPKDLRDLGDKSKEKVAGHANYLYVLRETQKALTEMVNFMKERKPVGFDASYDYSDYFEAIESQMARIISGLKAEGVSALEKPADVPAKTSAPEKKGAENMLNQEFTCYATGGKEPDQAAVEAFAKKAGMSVEEVEAKYAPVIISQPEGAFRKVVAKMLKKAEIVSIELQPKPATSADVTEAPANEEFTCYATGDRTPEQVAKDYFAKKNNLTAEEVEAKFVPEIVTQPEGAFRKMVAKMVKKTPSKPSPEIQTQPKTEPAPEQNKASKPATAVQEQPKAKLTPQQQKLVDNFHALKDGKRLIIIREDRIQVKGPDSRSIIDKGSIAKEDFPFLDQVAGAILSDEEKKRVRIEGHTDNRGGTKEDRVKRSQKCAESVRAYLVDRGVDASRLIVEGYGDTKPVAPNLTARGRDLNRRLEFYFPDEQRSKGEDELK